MSELLLLCHRIPYPPDKGEKIRAWNFLRHLAGRHRVHLGCFVDDERDWAHADALREICGECCFLGLDPRRARLRSLRGLLRGAPLTLPYFHDARLERWVRRILARPTLNRVFVYCSAMAQYVPMEARRSRRCVADLVDVDSEKWLDYARSGRRLEAWLFRREAASLRRVEQEIAETFAATLVATPAERRLLETIAPQASARIVDVANGVDSDYFSPDRRYDAPPGMEGLPMVFTGAMDYRPNIEAAVYFARDVLPVVRRRLPAARFLVVGANPAPAVRALESGDGIVVTGRVADVRPYLMHAKAVVAPLKIARGIQNKVLEGMAMARPVIASPQAMTGIDAAVGSDILVAGSPDAFADAIEQAMAAGVGDAIGRRARERVIAAYSWAASLARLDAVVDA